MIETGLTEAGVDLVLRHQAGELNRRAAGEMDGALAAAVEGNAAAFWIADMPGWLGGAHALLPVRGPLGACYAVVAVSPDSVRKGGVKTNADILDNGARRLFVRLANDALTEIWRARQDATGSDGRRMTSALGQLGYLLGGYTAKRGVWS